MKGALPEARYAILKLVPPNVWVFQGRADYKAKCGREASVPDFSRPWKSWMDRSAEGRRRLTYQFLDVGEDGAVIREANGRPSLYSDSFSELEASTANFPPESNGPMDPEVVERVRSNSTLPLPVRPLYDDEDIGQDAFGLYVINTDLRDAARTDKTLDAKLDEILRRMERAQLTISQVQTSLGNLIERLMK